MPLNSLRAFEATGHHLSFTRAADSLSVTQSAVSRHVINLEDLLGIRLFERKHHQLELTEQGRALLPVVTQAFDSLEKKMSDIVVGDGLGALRLAMPPTFAERIGIGLISEFETAYEDTNLSLNSLRDAVDLKKENLDLALVYTAPKVSEYVMDLLWLEKITPLCKPDVWAAFKGDSFEDFLLQNNLLHIKVDGLPYLTWSNWLRDKGYNRTDPQSGQIFDTASLATQYALKQGGIVITDPHLFQRELESGELVAPLEDRHPSGYGYYLLSRPEDLESSSVQNFRRWIISESDTISSMRNSLEEMAYQAETVATLRERVTKSSL